MARRDHADGDIGNGHVHRGSRRRAVYQGWIRHGAILRIIMAYDGLAFSTGSTSGLVKGLETASESEADHDNQEINHYGAGTPFHLFLNSGVGLAELSIQEVRGVDVTPTSFSVVWQ